MTEGEKSRQSWTLLIGVQEKDRAEWAQTKIKKLFLDIRTTLLYYEDGQTLGQLNRDFVKSPLIQIFKTQLDAKGDGLQNSWTRDAFTPQQLCDFVIKENLLQVSWRKNDQADG